MYFCGQFVKANYVIGVGMLEQENHPDERVHIAFLRVRYRFTLYMRHYAHVVYSEWFDLKGEADEVAKADQGLKSFQHQHANAVTVLRLHHEK